LSTAKIATLRTVINKISGGVIVFFGLKKGPAMLTEAIKEAINLELINESNGTKNTG
jgi:hypothetical protein